MKKKNLIMMMVTAVMAGTLLTGCGNSEAPEPTKVPTKSTYANKPEWLRGIKWDWVGTCSQSDTEISVLTVNYEPLWYSGDGYVGEWGEPSPKDYIIEVLDYETGVDISTLEGFTYSNWCNDDWKCVCTSITFPKGFTGKLVIYSYGNRCTDFENQIYERQESYEILDAARYTLED